MNTKKNRIFKKIFFTFFFSELLYMAESTEGKSFSFDDEDDEWNQSKIKGFKFEDDDETPFQDLAKYQAQTIAANSLGGKDEQTDLVISFDSALGTSSGTSRVVTDRVRAATGIPILIYFYCISKILLHFTIFKIF